MQHDRGDFEDAAEYRRNTASAEADEKLYRKPAHWDEELLGLSGLHHHPRLWVAHQNGHICSSVCEEGVGFIVRYALIRPHHLHHMVQEP